MTSFGVQRISLVVLTTILFSYTALSNAYTIDELIKDEYGQPLFGRKIYNILPANCDDNHELTMTYDNTTTTSSSHCPLFIKQQESKPVDDDDYDAPPPGGVPAQLISLDTSSSLIPSMFPIRILFRPPTQPSCKAFTGKWKLAKDLYVTLDGSSPDDGFGIEPMEWFKIEKVGRNDDGIYLINSCDYSEKNPKCKTLGLSKEDGMLGVKDVVRPFTVKFREAYDYVVMKNKVNHALPTLQI